MIITQRLNIGKIEVECMICSAVFTTNDIVTVVTMEDGCEAGNLCSKCAEMKEADIRKKIKANTFLVRQEAMDMISYADCMDALAEGEIVMPDPDKKQQLLKIVKGS